MDEIFRFYLAATLLGLLAMPLSFNALSSTRDRGASGARILGLTISAMIVRAAGAIGLSPWSSPAAWLLIPAAMLAWSGWVVIRRKELRAWLSDNLAFLLKLEAAHLAVFLGACYVMALSPGFAGTEKLMDFTLLRSILSSDSFPPEDLWHAGSAVNYYWFGHLQAALLCRISGVAPETGYNLASAFMFASIFQVSTGLFAIRTTGQPLAKGERTLHAGHCNSSLTTDSRVIFGGLLIAFAGNAVPLFEVLHGRLRAVFNYWEPSRIIPGAITEFPFFTLLTGDLHAHFLMLPCFILLAVWLAALQAQEGNKKISWPGLAVTNLLIMATAMGNTWNIPPMILLFTVMKLMTRSRLPWWGPLPAIVAAPLVTGVHGHHISIRWLPHAQTSPIIPFLLMWGIPVLIISLYLLQRPWNKSVREICKRKWPMLAIPVLAGLHSLSAGISALLITAMLPTRETGGENRWDAIAITGLLLIAIPEFVYLEDPYRYPFHRMNTVFKISYAAWPLVMAAAGHAALKMGMARGEFPWSAGHATGVLLVAALFIYPVATITDRAGAVPISSLTLNGFKRLEALHPHDMETVKKVKEIIRPGDRCLEAAGDSYSWAGRMAAFTGCPVLLGWKGHELLWRGKWAWQGISARKKAVDTIYSINDRDMACKLVREYKIDCIIACEAEVRMYGPEVIKRLDALFPEKIMAGPCAAYRAGRFCEDETGTDK